MRLVRNEFGVLLATDIDSQGEPLHSTRAMLLSLSLASAGKQGLS